MPTFSHSLEQALHRALTLANERNHEYATLEHLLLALSYDRDAAAVIGACNADLIKLHQELMTYLDTELKIRTVVPRIDARPTNGFQRVIQRAVIHVQSRHREVVTGADLLVAIFAERESHAAQLLHKFGMTRNGCAEIRAEREKDMPELGTLRGVLEWALRDLGSADKLEIVGYEKDTPLKGARVSERVVRIAVHGGSIIETARIVRECLFGTGITANIIYRQDTRCEEFAYKIFDDTVHTPHIMESVEVTIGDSAEKPA